MKAVIYARVSSKEQEQEGYSIPAQLKLLKEYAAKNNYQIVKEFVDIETAKKAGRENFNTMIQFVKADVNIKAVLCEKTDRLYRNFKDYVTVDELDLEIHLVKESEVLSKNSKSHQKFIHGIKVLMAKNYIDNLVEETRKGMLEKAERGIFPSGASLGYINAEKKAEGNTIRYLELDKTRAPVINKIFRLYATGKYSMEKLAEIAFDDGFRNKRGSRVNKSVIEFILKNPVYCGDFRWNNRLYQGTHEKIVTKELFEAAQAQLNGSNRPKLVKGFAYSGLLTCAKCGFSITAEIKKGRYVYYHCTERGGPCGNAYVREEELTKQFAEIVKQIHIDDEILESVKKALLESHEDERMYHAQKVTALSVQKERLENRIHQIYIDKLDKKISNDKYEAMTFEWNEELGRMQREIAKHENADANYLSQGVHILELCNRAYGLYLQQEPREGAKILHTILSNCKMDGVTLIPEMRKPFDIIAKGLSRLEWLPRLGSNQGHCGYGLTSVA